MIDYNGPRIKEIMNLKNRFLHFYFLNMDISVTIYIMDLEFSVCVLNVCPEGSMSQIFYLGHSFDFMTKNG